MDFSPWRLLVPPLQKPACGEKFMSPADMPRKSVQTIWEITRGQFVLTLGF